MANWKKGDVLTAEMLNQNGGGTPEPTYETVAEIQVGEMTAQGGLFMFQPENVVLPTDLTETDKLYWGDYPLERLSSDSYSYNFDGNLVPTGSPAYILQFDSTTGGDVTIVSDTDLSNTTVRILKQVEQGVGGSANMRVNFTITEGETVTVTADKTPAEIQAAIESGAVVDGIQNGAIFALYEYDYNSSLIFYAPYVGTIGYDFTEAAWSFEVYEETPSSYVFDFTVTQGQSESELVVTPDSGATYAAISAALAKTPSVYASIYFAPWGLTIRARFDIDIPGDPENALTANAFVLGGSKWMGARLSVVSDGTYGVELHET